MRISTNTKHIIAIINARGGSKSIPRKNIAPLAGKPLIAWTIEAAAQCKSLSRVIVSTDDEEIARISKEYGAEVPFLRPMDLAQDDSPHIPVLIHACHNAERIYNERYDYVMLLQPTSPLRSSDDIDAAINLAITKNADSVISIVKAESHPYLVKLINSEGYLEDFADKPEGYLRRQDLPPVFTVNGAIYLVRTDILIKEQTFYTNRTCAYVMEQERSIDIDSPWELYVAELILNDRMRHENH